MGIDQPLDITADQRKTILSLLETIFQTRPLGCMARVPSGPARPHSDLDMVVFATPKQSARVFDLREAFEESNLPFRVDLFAWDTVPEEFRRQIEASHVVLVEMEELSMADGWRETTLGNVIEFKRGYDLPKRERRPGAVPVVSSSGITGKHSESKVHGPGVVTGRYGTFGQIFFISGDFWPLNTTLYVRDFKGNDPRFVSYFLRGLDFSAYSDKAAVPGLNRNHIHQEIVRIPKDVHAQCAIAHILGTLDDKIELNRRTNETLEAMAQALFKSWFVDFEPVHAKVEGRDPGLPKHLANLFPARLIDSELGKIPEGWEVGGFGDVVEQLRDQKNPLAFPDTLFHHFSIPAFDNGQTPKPETEKASRA